MSRKHILVAGLVAALLCATVIVLTKQHRASADAASSRVQDTARSVESGETLLPAPAPTAASSGMAASNTPATPQTAEANVNLQKPAQAKAPKPEKVFQDPLARVALSLVGTDTEAEMYWFDAIQDPTLPKSERQDLIDDLNEEGLPDPKHPTLEDLPLILSRIEILEQLIPWLTDEFEWEEPYDDLVNLGHLAAGNGQGRPVN